MSLNSKKQSQVLKQIQICDERYRKSELNHS